MDPPLETHNAQTLPRERDQAFIDLVLRNRMVVWRLADVKPLRAGWHERQNFFRNKSIVDNDVGILDGTKCFQSEQFGVAWSSPHELHHPWPWPWPWHQP